MDIATLVRKKIVDPPDIKKHTISNWRTSYSLTKKFSSEELGIILNDIRKFKEGIREQISPLGEIPEIEIHPSSSNEKNFDLILSIGGNVRWQWK